MKCLYYCTTPLQVMVAVNMHYNQVLASGVSKLDADIVVVDIFRNAKLIADRLSNFGIFEKMYIIPEEDHKLHKNGIRKVLGIAYDIFFPKRLLKPQFGAEHVSSLKGAYDVIISSVFSHSVAALLTLNRKATYVMMDDGLASYFGDWTKRLRSNGYLNLLKLRNYGVDRSKPQTLYVMRASMCNSSLCKDIIQLPDFSESLIKIYKEIFTFSESGSHEINSIIWLTQPSLNSKQKEVADIIYQFLLTRKENVTVRVHPREKNERSYDDFDVDNDETLWEIKLMNMNVESSLLVTLNSTAVMTPKMLYNKEPWILFAYKLTETESNGQIDQIIEQLIEAYNDKEKILVAKDWDEFRQFVKRYSEE